MRNLTLAGKKIPMLFSIAADKYWSLSEDCSNDEKAMKNAFELYHKVYIHGLLQPRGAVEILDYRDNNQLNEGFPFSKEEMDNLDRFYSKEYRRGQGDDFGKVIIEYKGKLIQEYNEENELT